MFDFKKEEFQSPFFAVPDQDDGSSSSDDDSGGGDGIG